MLPSLKAVGPPTIKEQQEADNKQAPKCLSREQEENALSAAKTALRKRLLEAHQNVQSEHKRIRLERNAWRTDPSENQMPKKLKDTKILKYFCRISTEKPPPQAEELEGGNKESPPPPAQAGSGDQGNEVKSIISSKKLTHNKNFHPGRVVEAIPFSGA